MPSSSSSSNLPAYVYIPILGTPFWVLFHPDEDYQPFTTLYFGHHLSPISGHIAPAIALNAYPPPGLRGPLHGNQQAQQGSAASSSWQLPPVQSQASSSWQQPAHLVEPPPPQPVVPLALQRQLSEIIRNIHTSVAPFLSYSDIIRLRAAGPVFHTSGIEPSPFIAFTPEVINSIRLTPAGAFFLNQLIHNNKLTNIQIQHFNNGHLNLLDQSNMDRVFPVNPNQPVNPIANAIPLTGNQTRGLDMLHLFMLANRLGFRALETGRFINGDQREYIDRAYLRALLRATNNEDYAENQRPAYRGHSFSFEVSTIQQLFITAAGLRTTDFLPGIGAANLLDATTLSHVLPTTNYVVTELFYLYALQNPIHNSGGLFGFTNLTRRGNVSWLIPGSTLNQISNGAFSDLVQYINAHNTAVHFSVINLHGLSYDRFNQITDQTLLQAFTRAENSVIYDSWCNYLQTFGKPNSWGTVVHWLTFLSSNPNNGPFCVPAGLLDQYFAGIAQFVRNRITILQDMYNSMTEEQKEMFSQYFIPGGRRTEQTTQDSDVGTWADSVVANAHNLVLFLIQDNLKEVRADTKTNAFVSLGETKNGKLESNQDHDWFKVDVKAGISYKFLLKHTNVSDRLDPWLNLRDTNGKIIKSDDDSAGNLNSLIQFKATQNATYYLDACSWREISHGQFSLSVIAV